MTKWCIADSLSIDFFRTFGQSFVVFFRLKHVSKYISLNLGVMIMIENAYMNKRKKIQKVSCRAKLEWWRNRRSWRARNCVDRWPTMLELYGGYPYRMTNIQYTTIQAENVVKTTMHSSACVLGSGQFFSFQLIVNSYNILQLYGLFVSSVFSCFKSEKCFEEMKWKCGIFVGCGKAFLCIFQWNNWNIV